MSAPLRIVPYTAAAASAALEARQASIAELARKAQANKDRGGSSIGSIGKPAADDAPAVSANAPALPALPPLMAAAAPAAAAATAPSTPAQQYMERLIKLIPAEVVALYLFGIGVIPPDVKLSKAVWAVVCLGLVVLSRAYATADRENRVPTEWKAVFVSSVSFVIWVYNMPGPFQAYGLEVSYIGSLLVLVWTFVVPYFYK